MKKSFKVADIRTAVLSKPWLLPDLVKSNPKVVQGIMHKMLPFRVGIEIECFGVLNYDLRKVHDILINRRKEAYFASNKEHAVACKKDLRLHKLFINYSKDHDGTCLFPYGIEREINEHRISLCHKQLYHLYTVLEDMKRYCTQPEQGSIHVHVDVTKIVTNTMSPFHEKLFMEYFNSKEVLDRYADYFKYSGSYNRKRAAIREKGSFFNLRDNNLKTIEFRMLPQTFEYTTMVEWLLYITQDMKNFYKLCNIPYRDIKYKTKKV